MRIGIIVGISEYDNYHNLPGCINDTNAIHELLHSSKEFDDIRVFKGTARSDKIKSEIPEIFSGLKGKNIDELFFYFSGHGEFFNDEFYYILTDFNKDERRQTSLQNSEIDTMIKSIKPKIVTKVIDACNSGISYIKGDTNIVEKYYSQTTDNFNKCYFLHSSMTSQFSFQNSELSDFTKAFLEAIQINKKPDVRYKEIIDYISDTFEANTEQTPFFITQADFTEKFLNSNTEIYEVLKKYIKKIQKPNPEPKEENPITHESYIHKIKKDAELYSTQDEVIELLNHLKDIISKEKLQTEMTELFSYSHSFGNYLRDLPNGILIARWLESNENNFFAAPDYERESYKEEESRVNIFSSISDLLEPKKYVTKYRNVLKGFNQPIDIPYKYIIVDYTPVFPNLTQYALLITFLISKKEIKFFTAFAEYSEIDWVRKVINPSFKWSSTDFLIKEKQKVEKFIRNTILDSENFVMDKVKNKFNVKKN